MSEALKLAEEAKRLAAGVRVAITRQCMDPCAKNVARCDLADGGLSLAIDRLAALALQAESEARDAAREGRCTRHPDDQA